jgi:GT2 family glycosyltransferase
MQTLKKDLNNYRAGHYILRFFIAFQQKGLIFIFRKIAQEILIRIRRLTETKDDIYQAINHNPLVSVLCVNYNGAGMLNDFLESLLKQSYENLELLILDNKSQDNSINLIHRFARSNPRFNLRLIKSHINLGFAEGNNLLESKASGELVALINPDVVLDVDWLSSLVDGLRLDSSAAAVTSKTRFRKKFIDIKLEAENEFSLSILDLMKNLTYKKYFLRHGSLLNEKIYSVNKLVVISLPAFEDGYNFSLTNLSRVSSVINFIFSAEIQQTVRFRHNEFLKKINFQIRDYSSAKWVINNAGSMLKPDNSPYDRGFSEYDNGQYDVKAYVDAFCGCSVLLRRISYAKRKLFVPEFFAYYEDSELSRFLRKNSRILYAPQSLVYHEHAASTTKNPDSFNYLVSRSKAIYEYISEQNIINLKVKLNVIQKKYLGYVNHSLHSYLGSLNNRLFQRIKKKPCLDIFVSNIAVYNTYWSTYGGGELHALNILKNLGEFDRIFLLSENDFDVKNYLSKFNLDVSGYIKSIGHSIKPNLTKSFDIFVNSTYQSSLISKAPSSYFILNFPQKFVTKEFKEAYYFLPNSEYVHKWMKIFWGNEVRSSIYFPLDSISDDYLKSKINFKTKNKAIISIGRYFYGGHSKKQIEVLKAFNASNIKEFRLIFLGGLDEGNKFSQGYYERLLSLAANNKSVQIDNNVSMDRIYTAYAKALFYMSGSGINESEFEYPDRFEHFGIAVLEAACMGCIPIVHNVGGPSELVDKLGVGYKFSSHADLVKILKKVSKLEHEKLIELSTQTQKNARAFVINTINKNKIKYGK